MSPESAHDWSIYLRWQPVRDKSMSEDCSAIITSSYRACNGSVHSKANKISFIQHLLNIFVIFKIQP